MTTSTTITPESTMGLILEAIPAARRALFQRYHIGGCSSCAYDLEDTLAKVCADKNILDVAEVIEHLLRAQELDDNMQVDAAEVRAWLAEGWEFTFFDVRQPADRLQGDSREIPEAEPLEFHRSAEYMAMAKDHLFVFGCDDGAKSLDVAAYFAGHQFTNVRVLRGGFASW